MRGGTLGGRRSATERAPEQSSNAVDALPNKQSAAKTLEPITADLPEKPRIGFTRLASLVAKESRGSYRLTFSPDGKLLAVAWLGRCTVNWQGSEITYPKADVGIWDVENRRLLRVLPYPERSVRAIAFVPPGHRIVTACSDLPKVFLWDVESGRLLDTLDIGSRPSHYATGLAAFPDGKRVLVCCFTGLFVGDIENKSHKLLDLEDAAPFDPERDRLRPKPWPKHCYEVQFTVDGSSFATTVADDYLARRILLWDGKTCRVTGVIPLEGRVPGYLLAYSPDGRFVAHCYPLGGQRYEPVCVSDSGSRRLMLSGQLFDWGTYSFAFTSDSKYLIACGGQKDPSAQWEPKDVGGVWELASGKLVSRLRRGWSAVTSPDNRTLAEAGEYVDLYAIEHIRQ